MAPELLLEGEAINVIFLAQSLGLHTHFILVVLPLSLGKLFQNLFCEKYFVTRLFT